MHVFTRSLRLLSVAAAMQSAAVFAAPDYPVSVIVQVDPRGSTGATIPIADALRDTRMAYYDDSAVLRAALEARQGKTPPLIAYMGGFTSNYEDVVWLEVEHRRGVAMVDAAKLGANLDAEAREFTLVEPRDGELAVKASTADRVNPSNNAEYCFWIRIDDELMKVLTVDEKTGRVTVERGFDGSKAVAHAAGAIVLSPVYLGNRANMNARASSAWPGNRGRIRYALNPSETAAQAYKARCIVEMMKLGYDGAWWDTFQPQPFNLCDALGRKIDFTWDFSAGQRYTFRTSLDALKVYTRQVRAFVRQQTGREPVLYGNSVSGTYARGSKELMNSPTVKDLLDGYCFEDSYLDPQPLRDLPAAKRQGFEALERKPERKVVSRRMARTPADREPPAPASRFERVIGEQWLRNVTGQADAARDQLHALCMVGAAGYLGGQFHAAQKDYDGMLKYSYASYLLTVTSDRSTSFGLPLLVQNLEGPGDPVAVPLPQILYAKIGEPKQTNDIAALKVRGSECYAREFTNGFVAVYPQETGPETDIPVPAGLVDAVTGAPVSSLRLKPGEGAVLVRR